MKTFGWVAALIVFTVPAAQATVSSQTLFISRMSTMTGMETHVLFKDSWITFASLSEQVDTELAKMVPSGFTSQRTYQCQVKGNFIPLSVRTKDADSRSMTASFFGAYFLEGCIPHSK